MTLLAPACGVRGCDREAPSWSITGGGYRVCARHNLAEWLTGMERAGYGADAARIRAGGLRGRYLDEGDG